MNLVDWTEWKNKSRKKRYGALNELLAEELRKVNQLIERMVMLSKCGNNFY